MFWFRSKALSKAIGHGYTYDDFNIEYKPDFTKLHAIERIYAFAAQDSGYYYAEVLNSDYARSDLINLQYMVHQYTEIIYNKGFYPYNYEFTKEVLKTVGQTQKTEAARLTRLQFKEKIKRHTPRKLWLFMKKVYHIFGGKKWVG